MGDYKIKVTDYSTYELWLLGGDCSVTVIIVEWKCLKIQSREIGEKLK